MRKGIKVLNTLEKILFFVEQLPPLVVNVFIFFSALLENIFPPYPGDTVVIFAGYLAGQKVLSVYSVLLSSFLGSLIGGMLMYVFGEKLVYFLRKNFGKHSWTEFLQDKHLRTSQRWMEKYGAWIVIFSRFSAGIRFFVAIAAGISRMNILLFTVTFSLGTFLWNFILIFLAFQVGENWQRVLDFLRVYNFIIFALLFLFIAVWALYKVKKKQKKEKSI